jgi:hypothetical protein
MKLRLLVVGIVMGLFTGLALAWVVPVRAQVVVSEKLRFRLVGDEPIASGDGRSIVNGFKVIVLRDTKSDQCYVTFMSGNAMSVTGPSVCP